MLRAEATAFLRGCDHIVHAGDIGGAKILDALSAIAPLTAVRGNNDTTGRAASLPESERIRLAGIELLAIHDLGMLGLDPSSAGIRVVVSGHSHQPSIRRSSGVLFVNPGSAGPRRFRLPVSVAELTIHGEKVSARTVALDVQVAR